MSAERRVMERVRALLGEDEFNFVVKGGGNDLLTFIMADIKSLWPKWVAEGERISARDGHLVYPDYAVAAGCLGIGTSVFVDKGVSREQFLQLCADGYDVTVDFNEGRLSS